MKKKIISFLLVLLFLCSAIPYTAFAASSTLSSSIDLPAINEHDFGSGYEWDNRKCILTLNGLNLDTDDALGIKLPSGSTIILEGDNRIKASLYGIQCLGALTIKGDGTLTVTASEIGIFASSTQENHSITFREGSMSIKGAKNGIYSENAEIVFSGAAVKINASECSVFGKNIKAVSGSLEFTEKIKAKGTLSVSNTNLSVKSSDKAIEAERVYTKDVSISVGQSLSSLKKADEYNGEKAIKTIGTKKESKKGFLFGGKLPAFVDYLVIILVAVAAVSVIIVPIIIKRKKTAALIAKSEAQNKKKKK